MPPTSSRDLGALLGVLESGGSAKAAQLVALSDLDTDEVRQLHERWERMPVAVRRSLVKRTTELADDNLELDFSQLARVVLGDPDAEVRRLGVDALWESTDRHVADDLVRLLGEDSDEGVRAAAADGLLGYALLREGGEFNEAQGDRIVAALRRAAEGDESVAVRAKAVQSLGPRSLPWVDTLITDAYYHDDRRLCLGAVKAMGASASERWLEYLFEQLHSDEPEFRYAAVDACGVIGSEEAAGAVAELLDDPDVDVVRAAMSALGEIGGHEALRNLREFQRRVPEGLEEALADAIEAATFAIQAGEDENEDDEAL